MAPVPTLMWQINSSPGLRPSTCLGSSGLVFAWAVIAQRSNVPLPGGLACPWSTTIDAACKPALLTAMIKTTMRRCGRGAAAGQRHGMQQQVGVTERSRSRLYLLRFSEHMYECSALVTWTEAVVNMQCLQLVAAWNKRLPVHMYQYQHADVRANSLPRDTHPKSLTATSLLIY